MLSDLKVCGRWQVVGESTECAVKQIFLNSTNGKSKIHTVDCSNVFRKIEEFIVAKSSISWFVT